MSRFLKTIPGKGLLYAMVLITGILTLLCIGGAAYMIESDYYIKSEEEIERDYEQEFVISGMRDAFWDHLSYETGSLYRDTSDTRGNLLYRIMNEEGDILVASSVQPSSYDYTLYTIVTKEKNTTTDDYGYYCSGIFYNYDDYQAAKNNSLDITYIIECSIDKNYGYTDGIWLFHRVHHDLYQLKIAIYPIAAASVILFIISFAALMHVAGRRPDTDEIVPWYFHKVPFDIILIPALITTGIVITCSNGDEAIALAFVLFMGLFLPLLCMSAAVRIKTHTLIRNTIIFRVLMLLWKAVRAFGRFILNVICNTKLLFKSLIALAVLFLGALFVLVVRDFDYQIVLLGIGMVVLASLTLFVTLQINKLKKGAEELASGNFDHTIETDHMLPEIRKHADALNSIAGAQKIALDEKMRSERMKTELITNVSHDIKTPLTSIINYADLISKEDVGDKAKEYSEVLVRQSERLKRLLEDLIEASKAATGNIEIEPSPCDAAVFITQTSGEYEEKIIKSDLTLHTDLPSEEISIMADGRRMQRIFDNLMNNICKYSMPGTRVYLALRKEGNEAVFEFKNTSKEALNMSEEELMERFTRGDSSRNTEGSGLGLSIAKNLTELQGGTMRIMTDGDLFKAVLRFKTI